MDKLSHRERLLTILAGERPDRHAASFWRHFYHLENNAEGTADAMLRFQREYDWDFMKINPRADYHIEDWGLEQVWSKHEFEKHRKTKFPITNVKDWAKITPLSLNSPALAEHLKVVSLIRKRSDKELPLLMTVFTPLAIAGRMVEHNETLAEHLQEAPDLVESAVQAISETFVRFVSELRSAGADGIFFATTQWASSDFLTWTEYERFGLPYDLPVIRAAGDDAINLLHVCHSSSYLTQLAEQPYPAKMINWNSFDPTNLPLDKGYVALPNHRLVGGVDHTGWLLQSTPDEIEYLIDKLKDENSADQLIIGPGCSIEPKTQKKNLRVIRDHL
jgi:uroporphyrinogen decarboxylase